MKKLTVNIPTPYNILISKGLMKISGDLIREVTTAKKAFIISDNNVWTIYSNIIIHSLKRAGFTTCLFILNAGESSKTLSTIDKIYKALLDANITRSDIIISVGGGVVGDIAGFAAATFLRGISYVQIPTSLMAQIDSSVGGKTGINVREGKNLVGSFYQPALVIIDPVSLTTLSNSCFQDSMAEAIKYGLIKCQDLFYKIKEQDPPDFIDELIFSCINIKKKVVEEDPFDTNNRMILNFGHTIGHAIETHYNYKSFSHGQSVGIGMSYISKIGETMGITPNNITDEIDAILHRYSLPTTIDEPITEVLKHTLFDKKNIDNKLNLIFLSEIGKSFIYPISYDEFITVVKGMNL